jgi:uncharacterized protein (DUF1330 family)
MAAYLIADVEVTDWERYQDYIRLVPQSIAKHGGKYLVRGGAVTALEGSWCPKRLVILEFSSAEQARDWWASGEYRAAKALRHAAAITNLIVVEGV